MAGMLRERIFLSLRFFGFFFSFPREEHSAAMCEEFSREMEKIEPPVLDVLYTFYCILM